LQQLEQSAPELVARLNVVATRVNDLLNDDNRREISHILINLDNVTTTLSSRSGDIDAIIKNANQATAKLNQAADDIKPTFAAAQLTLGKFGKVADDADALVNSDGISQLPELVSDSRRLIGSVTKLSDRLNREPSVILFGDRRKGYEPK
jgi:phospholipid/cholesterol/gamma-HCH transport system substrate-binding protein